MCVALFGKPNFSDFLVKVEGNGREVFVVGGDLAYLEVGSFQVFNESCAGVMTTTTAMVTPTDDYEGSSA